MGRKNQFVRLNRNIKTKEKYNPPTQELHQKIDELLKISTSTYSQQNEICKIEDHQELFDLIDKIKNLELDKTDNTYIRNSQDKLSSFTGWLRENGAIFEGCSIAEFQGYELGLKADSDIPFGSCFMSIPKKLMLTIESAKESIMGNLIKRDHILKNMPNVTLAMYLLVEKYRENSFFKQYIDILPRTYSTVLYFSMDELQELRGSPTISLVLGQIRSIARQYAYFHSIFANSDDHISKLLRPHFTFKEYCWAVSTIMTRQNTIPSEDGLNKIAALIPLWDLLNHANGTISTDYNPELKRSECFAFKNFAAGDQIFIFYGCRRNSDFFIHNGFLPEINENDSYIIKLGLSKSDPELQERSQLLHRLNLRSTEEFELRVGSEPFDGHLIAFVRIFLMNKDHITHWINSDEIQNLKSNNLTIDESLDKKSWMFLQTRLNLLLRTYSTTLEEDLVLLKNNELSPNATLALKMRISEKKILTNAIEWIIQNKLVQLA